MKKSLHRLTGLKAAARKQGWAKWIRTPADERAVLNGCRFSIERAEHIVEFFHSFLRHSKGEWAGRPFELLDWQRDDVMMPLFGWELADGRRRYRKAYVEIPKKNGKSTLAAGLGLYMLAGDGEAGAEVYSAANDRVQASIVHGEAIRMVKSSPELKAVLKINESTKNIAYPETGSFYRALASEAPNNEGWNGHCCVIDELHMWRGRALWDALRYMFAARRQPLLFVITTAGDDLQSVCYEQHTYAQGVIDGLIEDDRLFGYIRGAAKDANWLAPQTWQDANPSLGVTMNADDFAHEAREASKSPSSIASFCRYRLNVWGASESAWLAPGVWDACKVEIDPNDLLGKVCWLGLDLAKTRDTTALVLAFPLEEGRIYLQPHFFLPRVTAEQQDGVASWLVWEAAGHVTLTDGDVCDYGEVFRRVTELHSLYQIQEIRYDPWQAELLTQQIEQGLAVDGEIMIEGLGIPRKKFPQTVGHFAAPTAEFERLALAGKLGHPANPLFDWQIGNTRIKSDPNGNKRPSKPGQDDPRKIDGAVAAIMALSGALERDGQEGIGPGDGVILI